MALKSTIRTKVIEIDLPHSETVPWISAKFQVVDWNDDGTVRSIRDDRERLNRRMDRVFMETVSLVDPVTQAPITISLAGISEAIRRTMFNWMAEDYNATLNEDRGLMELP